jgi:hypothetical protein
MVTLTASLPDARETGPPSLLRGPPVRTDAVMAVPEVVSPKEWLKATLALLALVE